jgi:formylglycine-generating enzyme required for sulfatase activity
MSEVCVLRGGSWLNFPGSVRASVRYLDYPGNREDCPGFRVLCSSPIE